MSAGDVSSEDWYGGGSGHGWLFDGDLTINLPAKLFVRGGVEWRKVTYDFDGSGELSWYWGVGTMRDTAVTGSASARRRAELRSGRLLRRLDSKIRLSTHIRSSMSCSSCSRTSCIAA